MGTACSDNGPPLVAAPRHPLRLRRRGMARSGTMANRETRRVHTGPRIAYSREQVGSVTRDSVSFFATAGLIALSGCGSSGGKSADASDGDAAGVANEGGGAGDGSSQGDSASSVDSQAGCPASEPAAGSPCSTTGICVYGASICCGGGFQCTAGTWQPVFAGCACIVPQTDGATDAPTDGHPGDGSATDAGACPASCGTDLDCNSCPQPSFGGWSCSGGVCRFMG